MSAKPTIAIFHQFSPPPTGGGHQFMRALCREMERRGIALEFNRLRAGTRAVLFNSYNFSLPALRRALARHPQVRRVHRVDGPLLLYRGMDDGTDRRIHAINREIADISIFQSRFSLEAHQQLGLTPVSPVIIPNAADPDIFFPDPRQSPPAPDRPLRIIAVSWSDNPNKGADVFAWLDEHLDTRRFAFTFVGRSAYPFRRLQMHPPVASEVLAALLRQHDLYLAASRNDPCSNALIEAISCGLPAVYRESGGHPEIAASCGLPFHRPDELPQRFEEAAARWAELRAAIRPPSIREIADRYLEILDAPPSTSAARAPRPTAALRAHLREGLRMLARRRWPAASRLILVEDRPGWVISEEMRALRFIARRLGIRCLSSRWLPFAEEQAVFYGSQFFLLADDWLHRPQRVAVAYFHGKPGTGFEAFDRLYERLCAFHGRLDRVQVSHSEMEHLVLASGIEPHKVHRIPIGLHCDWFPLVTPERRARARQALAIPPDAFVIGSFLKDGSGWQDGDTPKLIKGPDILLAVAEQLRGKIPHLIVLLSGPARGYVKKGLERLGVAWRHVSVARYREMARLYHAADVCLITSRQEGGPKAVLEAMASGIPLVTTRVGQAMDLVRHRENGWMADVGDVEALVAGVLHVAARPAEIEGWIARGRETAASQDYTAQLPLWRRFFEGWILPAGEHGS